MTYRFFYHFNKNMTNKTGQVVWSIHFRNQCYAANHVVCDVKTNTKNNKTQPRGIVQGFCDVVDIKDGVATIS